MAKTNIAEQMLKTSAKKGNRFAKPLNIAEEEQDVRVTVAEAEATAAENKELKTENAALKEKIDGMYIPEGYIIKKIPCVDTRSYSHQSDFEDIKLNKNKYLALIESIEHTGLAQPIVVREVQSENGIKYEIIIGHSRVAVYKFLAEQPTDGYAEKYAEIEARVYPLGALDDSLADDLFYESNFMQRGTLPVSAKSKCVAHIANKLKRVHSIEGDRPWYKYFEETYGMKVPTIYELLAVSRLCPELMKCIENRTLKQKYASKLAKLSEADQKALVEQCISIITNKNIDALKIDDDYEISSVISDLKEINDSWENKPKKVSIEFADSEDLEAFKTMFKEWQKSHITAKIVK